MTKETNNNNSNPNDIDEELTPAPVPALVVVLLNKENEKDAPLTKNEVLEIHDNAACMMLPIFIIHQMDETRGYSDIIPKMHGKSGK